jgi:hypothetical protein
MADHSGALGAHYRPQDSSRSKLVQVIRGLSNLSLSAAKKVKNAVESAVAYREAKEAAAKEAAKAAKEAAAKAAKEAAAKEQDFVYQPSEREPVMSRARTKAKKAAMSTINVGGSNKKPVKKPLKKLVKKPLVKPAKKKVATTRARK